jgi:ketosteroid isomerase-like protein
MKKTVFSAMIIIVMFSANIAFSQSASDYKSKIESINKQMSKDMLAGNTEKLLSMYTSDAISMPNYQPIEEGIAEIRKANEAEAKTGIKYTAFTPTILKVIPNGNLITEIGTYKISLIMPKSDKPVDEHGKYLTIWEKQKDGSLKVKIETWNSDVDPMNMMSQPAQKSDDKK